MNEEANGGIPLTLDEYLALGEKSSSPSLPRAPNFVPTQGDRIKKLSITHDILMDWMLLNPGSDLRQCSAVFGYSQAWISSIVNSGAFQSRLAEKRQLIDAQIASDLPTKLSGLAHIAVDNLTRELEQNGSADLALRALDSAMKGLNPKGSSVTINQQHNPTSIQQVFATPADLAAARAMMQGTFSSSTPIALASAPDAAPQSGLFIEVANNGEDSQG